MKYGKSTTKFLQEYRRKKKSIDYKQHIHDTYGYALDDIIIMQDHSNKPNYNFFYKGRKYVDKQALEVEYVYLSDNPEEFDEELRVGRIVYGEHLNTLDEIREKMREEYYTHFVPFMKDINKYNMFTELVDETDDFYIFEMLDGYHSITVVDIEENSVIIPKIKI